MLYLGDNCIQNFHFISWPVSWAVKRDFRTYIQRYTSLNENFEYGYPHSNALLTFSLQKDMVKMYFVAPTSSRCQLH